jgi:hypothetical protein
MFRSPSSSALSFWRRLHRCASICTGETTGRSSAKSTVPAPLAQNLPTRRRGSNSRLACFSIAALRPERVLQHAHIMPLRSRAFARQKLCLDLYVFLRLRTLMLYLPIVDTRLGLSIARARSLTSSPTQCQFEACQSQGSLRSAGARGTSSVDGSVVRAQRYRHCHPCVAYQRARFADPL